MRGTYSEELVRENSGRRFSSRGCFIVTTDRISKAFERLTKSRISFFSMDF